MVASAKLSQSTQQRVVELAHFGGFDSGDELVTAALDLLEDQIKRERLERSLQEAEAEADRGELVLDTPEWREEFTQDILSRYRNGERSSIDDLE